MLFIKDVKEVVHNQECLEVWEGATVALNTQSINASTKEILWTLLPSHSDDTSSALCFKLSGHTNILIGFQGFEHRTQS